MNISSKVLYAKPSITDLEIAYATDAVAQGWGEHCYDYIHRFEQLFSQYIGTIFAHATSSATGALHLGLAALGIGPGDEVILADTNWCASVAPVVHLGAIPVFVDILPDTWCLDPEKVEMAITERTKAILAVHLYGNLCDMDRLEGIAEKYHLYLIEDASEAIGSHWKGRQAGSRGIFGIFSFHGTKTVTTGEGGMFVTQDADLYDRVIMLNNHGRRRGEERQFWASVIGYKYKISNIEAAIGCAQLERITTLVQRRRDIFFYYKHLLADVSDVYMNPVPEYETYGYWMPTLVFSEQSRLSSKKLLDYFQKNNIEGRAFFSPLSLQAHFRPEIKNSYSHSLYTHAINLPSYHDMTVQDQERVIAVFKEHYL